MASRSDPALQRPRRRFSLWLSGVKKPPAAAALVTLILAAPIAAGLAGTVLPAFGVLPALGYTDVGLDAFARLFETPGLSQSIWLSVRVGLIATILSLSITFLGMSAVYGTRLFRAMSAPLAILLSVPHAAAAFGLAFLLLPSGWIARSLSPWLTGWEQPPDLLTVQDAFGASLILGLVIKEVPFLFLMAIAAMGQVRLQTSLQTAAALGYRPTAAWFKVVFPLIYRQIRLPVLAVLAFSISVVDVALILGPTSPPTLAVQILRWMNDPDLAMRLQAAAGALLQLGLVLAALALWWAGEGIARTLYRRWIFAGRRGTALTDGVPRAIGFGTLAITGGLLFFGVIGLALWSVAGLWPFPNVLPDQLTGRSWGRNGASLRPTVGTTVLVASVSTAIALCLAVWCLETESQNDLAPGHGTLWLLYLPLLVPQIAFLGGLQTLTLTLGVPGGILPVVAVHLVFVLPYVFLTLADTWRAWDRRYAVIAHALGASRIRVLFAVRLPMLIAPVLTAGAVGFSVSVGQYLPTLLIGGGRVETLTTEAVALASGNNRRVIGVTALLQTAVAAAPFLIAIGAPRLLQRRQMR